MSIIRVDSSPVQLVSVVELGRADVFSATATVAVSARTVRAHVDGHNGRHSAAPNVTVSTQLCRGLRLWRTWERKDKVQKSAQTGWTLSGRTYLRRWRKTVQLARVHRHLSSLADSSHRSMFLRRTTHALGSACCVMDHRGSSHGKPMDSLTALLGVSGIMSTRESILAFSAGP